MSIYTHLGARVLGGAAAATLALGLAAGPASAHAAASATVTGDTLSITGTPGADHVALRLAQGDANTLQIDFNDDGRVDQSFDRGTFSKISVLLGNGDDSFRIDQVNGAFADEVLTVDGGSGDDNLVGGDGNETFIGGTGRDSVFGKKGADTAVLGSGQDSFTWDPGDGSDTIEGGQGYDTMVFHGSAQAETMSLSPNGTRTVFLRDLGNIRMDMGGVEALDLATLGGADKVTINDTTGTGFRSSNIDLSGAPHGSLVTVNGTPAAENISVDAHADTVDVSGFSATTHVTGSDPSADQLEVNGLGGRDSARIGAGVSSLIDATVHLA
jgi:Ca2+-binding RTX toxin-like protein